AARSHTLITLGKPAAASNLPSCERHLAPPLQKGCKTGVTSVSGFSLPVAVSMVKVVKPNPSTLDINRVLPSGKKARNPIDVPAGDWNRLAPVATSHKANVPIWPSLLPIANVLLSGENAKY